MFVDFYPGNEEVERKALVSRLVLEDFCYVIKLGLGKMSYALYFLKLCFVFEEGLLVVVEKLRVPQGSNVPPGREKYILEFIILIIY